MLQLTYPEFDGFSDALQGVQGHYVLRSRQDCEWRLRILDVDGAVLMAGRDGAANIYSGASTPGSAVMFIPLRAHASVVVNGQRFDRQTLAWLASDRMFHISTDVSTPWISVSLPASLFENWLNNHGFDPQSLDRSFTRVVGDSVASLVQLAARVLLAEAHSKDGVLDAATRRAAHKAIVDATLRTLMPPRESREAGRPAINRTRILSNALGMIEAATDEPIYTEDLCRTARVSERTLRNVFQETFGMAPNKYLMLARLNRARSAIRSAPPGATLASICTDLGFWDFGLFARKYREVFGELPSQALSAKRRAAGAH